LDIPQPPSFDQVARLWHYLHQQKQLPSEPPVAKILNLRNMLLFVLIYKCGLKAQDLAGLAKSHAIISGPKSRHRIIVTPRKRDPYTIPLPPIFSGLFIEYDQLIKRHFHKEWELNESLLVTANHFRIIPKAISVRGLEMVFEDLRRKVSLAANFNAKTLRQAGIFCWLHEGHHENLIKEWLGVAPSYSLNPYSDHKWQNIFQDHFLRTLAKKEDEKASTLLEEEIVSHPQ
jgi:integrase